MKVQLTYHDNEALTVEEVVATAVHNYGKSVQVEVMPESTIAYDLIYFGLQQLTTHQQLSIMYDRGSDYQTELRKLRQETLYKVTELIDQVLIDNEARVG